jgi:SNF2 family DNA or RNA helicase
LEVNAAFHYGDERTVPAFDPRQGWTDSENGQILLRDPAAEKAALESLDRLGFLTPPRHRAHEIDFTVTGPALNAALDPLLEEGWQILLGDSPLRRAGGFQLRVATGIDWFGIEGEVFFDESSVSLPTLLAAAESGSRFVKLDGDSVGVLPQSFLDRGRQLTDLAWQKEGDSLHFHPSQALLLDFLLEGQKEAQVERDAGFRQLRERLASFEGVTEEPEPEGFSGQLRPYQRLGLGWLSFLAEFGLGGCLADDMGLGKTVQVLALLQQRHRQAAADDKLPSLVIVPKTLVHNWMDEASRFAPELRVFPWVGKDRKSRWAEGPEVELIVTTYATLRLDIAVFKDLALDYAIVDEAQAIKNPGSQIAKACRLLKARHRLAMTGTPVENHLGDLWSIFEFLNPGMLGRSQGFQRFAQSKTATEVELEVLNKALRPFLLRRTKEEVLKDLPEKSENLLFCELEPKEQKLYDELRAYYQAMLDKKISSVGLKRSKIHVLEALLRLRQAACHPGLVNKELAKHRGTKIELLLEHLEELAEGSHKALVFSQFTSFLALVQERLREAKIPFVYLDGKTTRRQEVVQQFQTDSEIKVFLISLKAGGVGLNLTAADYVFLLDPWWNPAVESQAIDRTHRIGQTRSVIAYRIIAKGTVEEKVLQLQDSKRELAHAILSQDSSLLRHLSSDDLEFLLS